MRRISEQAGTVPQQSSTGRKRANTPDTADNQPSHRQRLDPAVANALLQAQKARLVQQLHQLADQFATKRESAGRQEPGQIAAAAATEEQAFWTGLQSGQGVLAAVANWLVFDPEPSVPPAAPVAPIRTSDGMFGDIAGRPTDATVH